MSPHFPKCPCPENLIQIESGPSLDNLLKEIRYSEIYKNNPESILEKSKHYNMIEESSLGGDVTSVRMLPDIHPCNKYNIPNEEYEKDKETFIENLKEAGTNEGTFNVCYIITGFLLIALIIIIMCKMKYV